MRALTAGLVAAAALSACAGRTARRSCTPVSPEISVLAREPVFADCEVDRKAVQSNPTRLSYTPMTNQTCGHAVVDVVIDRDGHPLRQTAVVIRSNDAGLTDALLGSLPAMVFQPAVKDNHSVAQLMRIEHIYMRVAVPAGTPAAQGRPPRGRPRC
jgi:hypothetical protein